MSGYEEYLSESLSKLRTVIDDSGSRPILFVGSGMSIRYLDAPNWIGLLEELIHKNPNITLPIGFYAQDTGSDLPEVASRIIDEYRTYAWHEYKKGIYPDDLYDPTYDKSIFLKYTIKKIFDELISEFDINTNMYQSELLALKDLNPHAIITTNYDQLLEKIFPEYKVVVGQQVILNSESTNIGHLLKIHGCTTKPEEIIISSQDYKKFSEEQKYLSAKLLTYFMEHPIVFLGYSIRDNNIQKILSDISRIVSRTSDDIVDNIWFVEWKKDEINIDSRPPRDKTIPLGNDKSIRVNYILLNSYEELYKSLYQNNASGVDVLNQLQKNVYNIVKSKSVTDLEVDLLNINRITNEDILAQSLGFRSTSQSVDAERIALMGVGNVGSAEQLLTRYPMRISEMAQKLGYKSWYQTNEAIKTIYTETGFNMKESNNRYHVDIGKKQSEHRYSNEALDLIRKVLNDEDYTVIINDDDDDGITVTKEKTLHKN
ncbi:SIR2 family protein [Alteribacillus bidgolensis]|uniref:SIR2-like domain-containing protein n=1 Tax=Alteribacillus bidgolensis TaxID=930129 RepID=A0A1G8Q7Y8_9BACI|nr:SIR2 family protein [Alteribacillus bidgolensis]SDJ00676.1 SIR2-like domain-containing protein [Alteribacillus bidgolensis]